MFIKEFDLSLNITGIIARKAEDDLGHLSAKFGTKYVTKIRRKGGNSFRMVNVPSFREMPQEEVAALNKLGKKEGHGWFILDESIDPDYISFFNNLIDIPSVVIDSVLTTEGEEHIYFRAHENDRAKIRDLVYADSKSTKKFWIEKLDFSPGLLNIMKSIDRDIELSYLEFRMKIPPTEMTVEKDPVISTFGNNWFREMKYLMDENVFAIYYEKSKILRQNPNIIEISREDNIFRMNYSNPVINSLVEESTAENIGILNLAQRMLGRDFYLSYIIPKMCLPKMNNIISDLLKKYKKWEIMISQVADIRDS